MKRIAFCLAISGLLSLSTPVLAGAPDSQTIIASASSEEVAPAAEVNVADNNVIDKAFDKAFDQAQATAEINYVSEEYLEAWKAELANVAGLVKKSFVHKEDEQRIEDYLGAYETLIQKAFDLEMLNWLSDPAESLADRSFGTGGTGAAMLAQAKLYKQATLNLIDHYQSNPEKTYQFAYKGTGPDLEKLRAPQD